MFSYCYNDQRTLLYCTVQQRWVPPEQVRRSPDDGEPDHARDLDTGPDHDLDHEHALARMADEGCPNHDNEE